MRTSSCLLGAAIALGSASLVVAQTVHTPDPVQDYQDYNAAPPTSAQESAAGVATSGGTAIEPEPGRTPDYAIGTIVETQPPAHGTSAAAQSADPLVMRREARAQARAEYHARKQEARREYRADKRAADHITERQSGW